MNQDIKEVQQKIKSDLKNYDISQAKISEYLNVSRVTINKWLNQEKTSIVTLARLIECVNEIKRESIKDKEKANDIIHFYMDN